jgi:hypothetical protein
MKLTKRLQKLEQQAKPIRPTEFAIVVPEDITESDIEKYCLFPWGNSEELAKLAWAEKNGRPWPNNGEGYVISFAEIRECHEKFERDY